jgi:hypothetical protein
MGLTLAPGSGVSFELAGETLTVSASGGGGGGGSLPGIISAADHGASPSATATANRDAFEAAVNAAVAIGGGVIYVPPSATVYDIAAKTWSDVGGYRGCVRLKANVSLWLPAGATIRMGANQITNVNTMVVLPGGSNSGVFGEGVIDGGSLLSQSSYSSGYLQNGPAGVFLLKSLNLKRIKIGAGKHGYLTIQNCFGNAVNGSANHVTLAGIKTDNVGEGCQIELSEHVEMFRIESYNTLGNMVGDGLELSAVRYFAVADIYAEKTTGSGVDIFGCQDGTVDRFTGSNCNLDIHDFAPVSPCENVTATNVLIKFDDPTFGVGQAGINVTSAHATKAPKNIKVQGRVINEGAGVLQNGVRIIQSQDVATYGGGPYEFDVDVKGVVNAGYVVDTKAPRLTARGRVDNCNFGLDINTPGVAATDNIEWKINLDIRNSGASDIRIQGGGANPSGILEGHFTSANGSLRTFVVRNKTPRILTTADNPAESRGYPVVKFTGTNAGFWDHAADGEMMTVIFTVSGTIYDYATSGAYAITKLNGGVGSRAYAAGEAMRLIYDATVAAGTGTGVWYEI